MGSPSNSGERQGFADVIGHRGFKSIYSVTYLLKIHKLMLHNCGDTSEHG